MTIKVDALVTHLDDKLDIGMSVRGLRFWSRVGIISNRLFIVEGWGGPCGRTPDAPLWVLTADIFTAIESCRDVDPATKRLSVYARLDSDPALPPVIEEIEEVFDIPGEGIISIRTKSGISFEYKNQGEALRAHAQNKLYPFG